MKTSKAPVKKAAEKTTKKSPKPPPENLTLTERFVWAAHGDLHAVREMLAEHPHLLDATYNETNQETALGAACQMKETEIVEFLLSKGAKKDIFSACVLGRLGEVSKMLSDDPPLIRAKNKHGHNHTLLKSAEHHPALVAVLKSRGAK